MPPAVDFILYCLGISTILVSSGLSIKLVTGASKARVSKDQAGPKWEPMPDPASQGLESRLQAFQAARYASPIIQRHLNADTGPRPTPTLRPPPPRPPIPIRKPPAVKTDDKVVPLPLKMKKDTDKEE